MASEIATADKLQNEFITSISHELRTPLTAIKVWSETLRDGGIQDEELVTRGLEVISNEAQRLSNMVEELLDFSNIQKNNKSSSFEKLDLFAEVEETVFLFRERANREGLNLRCVLQEDLPPVKGDRNQLRQVFSNILDNAIKYSQELGVIRVEAAAIQDGVQVVISDNGIGISEESLPNVKNKFYRANNLRPGSGIGLAVADEIVQAHGGTLEVESIPDKGTVVTVTLPIYER
jgi:signal transduction histidine kinase